MDDEEVEPVAVAFFVVFFLSPSSLCFSILLIYSEISSDSKNYDFDSCEND